MVKRFGFADSDRTAVGRLIPCGSLLDSMATRFTAVPDPGP